MTSVFANGNQLKKSRTAEKKAGGSLSTDSGDISLRREGKICDDRSVPQVLKWKRTRHKTREPCQDFMAVLIFMLYGVSVVSLTIDPMW